MSAPFKPANGERARWCYVYDLVNSRNVGEEVTYYEVQELLGVDRETARAAVSAAIKHLEEDGCRSLRPVRKFGWIVMKAADHIGEGERYLRGARSKARVAARKIDAIATRRGELTQAERQAADFAQLRAQFIDGATRRNRQSFAQLALKTIKAAADG